MIFDLTLNVIAESVRMALLAATCRRGELVKTAVFTTKHSNPGHRKDGKREHKNSQQTQHLPTAHEQNAPDRHCVGNGSQHSAYAGPRGQC